MKDERAGRPTHTELPVNEFPCSLSQWGNTPFKVLDPSGKPPAGQGRPLGCAADRTPAPDPGPVLPPEPQPPARGTRRRPPRLTTQAREFRPRLVLPGWIALLGALLCGAAIAVLVGRGRYVRRWVGVPEASPSLLICLALGLLLAVSGLLANQEGFAVVLSRWGRYRGTVRRAGLMWVNPLLKRHRVDVRLRHFRGDSLAAVDRVGHPVLVSLLVVWRVQDTARATFAVGDHEEFLRAQAAATVSEVTATLPADRFGTPGPTLRDGTWFGEELTRVLAPELAPLGLEIYSVQPLSLGYGTEIAESVRRLQRAELDADLRTTVISDAVDVARTALDRIRADEDTDTHPSAGQDSLFLRLLVLSLLTPSANLKEWGIQWPEQPSSSKRDLRRDASAATAAPDGSPTVP